MEKLPLRIATFNKAPIIEIINEGGEKNCRFTGIIGYATNDLVEQGNFNCTVIQTSIEEGYGQLNRSTGKYNGMHGCVQANLSDLGFASEMVPLETDDFKYGPVLTSSQISIASLYRPCDGGFSEDLSVMDSFDSVSHHVWLLLFALVITFWILLATGKRLLRKNNRISNSWIVVTFLFNEETFELSGLFFCTISFSITLLAFYIHAYLGNFIKTEMVQPRFPIVINSFEDVLKLKYHPDYGFVDKTSIRGHDPKSKNLNFIFTRQMRTIDCFRYEPKGSIRRNIYDKALKIHGSHEKILHSFDITNTKSMTKLLLKNENVMFEKRLILQFLRVLTCTAIMNGRELDTVSDLSKSSVWFAKNASIPYSFGYIYSENISPKVRDRLDWYFYKLAESGIIHVLIKRLSDGFLPIKAKMYSCMEDEMSVEIPSVEHLGIKHIASLFDLTSKIFLFVNLALLIEVFLFSFLSKNKKRRLHK